MIFFQPQEGQDILSISFHDWYKNEKNDLSKEYPNVDDMQLAKIATRKFRTLKQSASQESKVNIGQSSLSHFSGILMEISFVD